MSKLNLKYFDSLSWVTLIFLCSLGVLMQDSSLSSVMILAFPPTSNFFSVAHFPLFFLLLFDSFKTETISLSIYPKNFQNLSNITPFLGIIGTSFTLLSIWWLLLQMHFRQLVLGSQRMPVFGGSMRKDLLFMLLGKTLFVLLALVCMPHSWFFFFYVFVFLKCFLFFFNLKF